MHFLALAQVLILLSLANASPVLACRSAFSLTAIDIAAGCVIFFVGEVLLSYLFFRLRLRDRRY
ncbi:MAG: hypothetical protein WCB61_24895 [Pseudolabrys sp.]